MSELVKIFIDAGHGGNDPGAVKFVTESKVNIKVVNYMYDHLKNNYVCSVKKDITGDSIFDICADANKWGADLFISIHFNAGGGDGFEAWVHNRGNKALGDMYCKHVVKIGQNSRGTKFDPDLIVLKYTDMKAVLCECAFVDNKKDIKDWDENAELKKMGIALAEATADYLNLKKKTTAKAKTLKVGSKVKIKSGAKDLNTGKKYSDFVYKTTYKVISITGSRVVFGLNGAVTGATNKSNVTVV